MSQLQDMARVFYGGAAGIALSIATGIDAGLIPNDEKNRNLIGQCLSGEPSGVDVATGVAGQAIAALQCASYIESDHLQHLMQSKINRLMSSFGADGIWVVLGEQFGKKIPAQSFSLWQFGYYVVIVGIRCTG